MAAEPLSAGWLDAVAESLETVDVPGAADGVAQFLVKGAPAGAGSFHAVVSDGRVSLIEGRHRQPDMVMSWSYGDFVEVWRGTRSLESAYMSGRVKLEGDQVLLFDGWRPLLRSPEIRKAVTSLH